MPRRLAIPIAVACLVIAGIWGLFVALPRYSAARSAAALPDAPPASSASPEAARKITATLYYLGDDGADLVGVQREVPFAEPVDEQARRILEAQLEPAAAPLVSAVPAGAKLRAIYLTPKGDAFVDLTREVRDAHPGGALEELFTVYSLVNALTVNLPAVQRVQILIEGQEVDTLAGHVDLRHPLPKNLTWIRSDEARAKDQ
jgi:hypothetical protein